MKRAWRLEVEIVVPIEHPFDEQFEDTGVVLREGYMDGSLYNIATGLTCFSKKLGIFAYKALGEWPRVE